MIRRDSASQIEQKDSAFDLRVRRRSAKLFIAAIWEDLNRFRRFEGADQDFFNLLTYERTNTAGIALRETEAEIARERAADDMEYLATTKPANAEFCADERDDFDPHADHFGVG